MEDWINAGKIAGECLNYGCDIAKPGITLLELAEKIEGRIKELGAKPAFPVNLSLNSMAAHYTPSADDKTVFGDEDILKIDVGVHVNGHIGDTARTLGKDANLIKASEDALNAAIQLCVPGVKLREIGKVIANAISDHNFISIRNLSGHGITTFNLHSGISIPNYDNGDEDQLKEGQIIAIEPFATNGSSGRVAEGKPSGIYKLARVKPVRDPAARKMLSFIANEYSSLPFASRWLEKDFPKAKFLMQVLFREGILRSYPQLYESSKGNVSQAEHTILIKEKPVILTKI
ncbi:MAG TPA: type II methionyl aminopeptidase [Nanoarchaeota archaeon]|nr:type II methionyl aminopeptidase [Nanoarchaeota archaeon]